MAVLLYLMVPLACATGWARAPGLPPDQSQAVLRTNSSVRIGVFSLFHPHELRLQAAAGSTLTVELGGGQCELRGEDAAVVLREMLGAIELRCGDAVFHGARLLAHPAPVQNPEAAGFRLEVPGKLRRPFAGTLEIGVRRELLVAVVTMPLETAVASIVQAESPAGAGIEALKAQAVASRSFLSARRAGHSEHAGLLGFDFCDTTHCQFLRSPPAAGSPADTATRLTAGLVLLYHPPNEDGGDTPVAAMYARSCGGRTRTLREIGLRDRDGYPYYSVRCRYCLRHPERWQRRSGSSGSLSQGSVSVATEQERLAWNRIHGWAALPSLPERGSSAEPGLAGQGNGHGLGLCQLGAADMARHGADFARILAHYYPNTRIAGLPKAE